MLRTISPVRGDGAKLLFWVAAGSYFLLIGGTEAGTLVPILRVANAVLGALIVGLFLAARPSASDWHGRLPVIALVAFAAAGVLSRFPRMSLDAVAAAAAFACAFLLLRQLPIERRVFLLRLLAIVGVVLVAEYALLWSAWWLDWLRASGGRIVPPSVLALPVGVFRHPQVIGITIGLVAPSVLLVGTGRPARVIHAFVLTAAGVVVLASGSRTALVAALVASAVVVARRWVPRERALRLLSKRRLGLAAFAVAGAAVAGVAAVGASGSSTVEARLDLWAASIDGWISAPLFGQGPGSFGAAIGSTGYFDRHLFEPAHADNAFVQLLFEGGAVTAGAAAILVISVLTAAFRHSSNVILWTLIFATVATFADNPTDFPAFNAVVVLYAATAVPAAKRESGAPERSGVPVRFATIAAALGVGLTVAASSVGTLAYASARDAASTGRQNDLVSALRTASLWDPGQGLYHRELGLALAKQGDIVEAYREIAEAIRLVPTDDTALRALALLALDQGDGSRAVAVAAEAVASQATDTRNLLVQALAATSVGDQATADDAIARALEVGPWLAAAPGWAPRFPSDDSLQHLLILAYEDSTGQAGDGIRTTVQRDWLSAMAGLSSIGGNKPAAIPSPTDEAISALLACNIDTAVGLTASPSVSQVADPTFWILAIAARQAAGIDASTTVREAALARGSERFSLDGSLPSRVSAVSDPAQDERFFNQLAVGHGTSEWPLPSIFAGQAMWMRDPIAAADLGAPASGLATCR